MPVPDFKVYLAPMEGLADAPLRKILCAHGNYDECFSEFIRVTDLVLSEKTLYRIVPELENGCKTADGTSVRVQLLGDNPDILAKSACVIEKAGAQAIDMNFGCPSRFVHHAGSMLLQEPSLMHDIVKAMRDALDPKTKLSVKIRAGFADKKEAPNLIKAIAIDGVDEIIMHCRTRRDLYRKEALDWSVMKDLHSLCPNITLVANGDIVSHKTALTCHELTGCSTLMCGRGAFLHPNLGDVIKNNAVPYDDVKVLEVMLEVMNEFVRLERPDKTVMDRAKQFLGYARQAHPNLAEFFKGFCRIKESSEGFYTVESEIKRIGG